VCHDVIEVEVAIVGLMKVNEDSHNPASSRAGEKLFSAKVTDLAEQLE